MTIKGVGDSLEIKFHERASYAVLREDLLQMLQQHQTFFDKPDVKVVISGRPLSEAQRREIKRIFSMDYEITRVFFKGEEPVLKEAPVKYEEAAPSPIDSEGGGVELVSNAYFNAQSIFINHTVRSGQRIECEGDIVVIGDVNPGAEVIAGGSIAVFGVLRGLAHAGAGGREDVCVAALYMRPKQLRLSGRVVIPEPRARQTAGEIAEWQNGQIVIRPVQPTRN